MSEVTVHAGDFPNKGRFGHTVAYFNGTHFQFPRPGRWAAGRSTITELVSVEVVTEQDLVEGIGPVGRGLVGLGLSGGVGLVVGPFLGGSGHRKIVTFVARFDDGRELLGTSDMATFLAMKAAVFDRGRKPQDPPPSWDERMNQKTQRMGEWSQRRVDKEKQKLRDKGCSEEQIEAELKERMWFNGAMLLCAVALLFFVMF